MLFNPFKRRIKSHPLALLGAHHILHVSRIRVNVEKCGRARHATIENTAHAHCMHGYLRLQIHTQDMWYLLLFHCKSGRTNAPQCYEHVNRTLPVFFVFVIPTNICTGFVLTTMQCFLVRSLKTWCGVCPYNVGTHLPDHTVSWPTKTWLWRIFPYVLQPAQRPISPCVFLICIWQIFLTCFNLHMADIR